MMPTDCSVRCTPTILSTLRFGRCYVPLAHSTPVFAYRGIIIPLLNILYHHFEVIIMKDFRKFNRKLEIVESLGGYRLPNICEQQQAMLHIIKRAESNRGAAREWTMQKHVVLDLFM